MLNSHQGPRYRQDKYLVCKVSFSIQPTSPYVAQELPKRPSPGTGLPWRISGPLNRRLGLFGCSSAAESGHAAAPGAPDRYSQPARQHRGASWPGCLFAHPALPALPSVCHCLLSATVILSQNSPIPIWLAVLNTYTRRTHSAFFWTRLGLWRIYCCFFVAIPSLLQHLGFCEHVLPAPLRARTTTTGQTRAATGSRQHLLAPNMFGIVGIFE